MLTDEQISQLKAISQWVDNLSAYREAYRLGVAAGEAKGAAAERKKCADICKAVASIYNGVEALSAKHCIDSIERGEHGRG